MAIVLPDIKPTPCAECGMAEVHHGAERWLLRIDVLARPLTRLLDPLTRRFAPVVDVLINVAVPPAGWLLVKTGLAIEVRDLRSHPSETTQALFEEAEKRGIQMWELRLLGLPRRIFLARYKKKTWVFEGLPRPVRVQPSISWIDDKAEVKRRFEKAGFPVPQGALCKTESRARDVFARLHHPVIVKPHEGSGGRHVTVHITTADELAKAFRIARQVSPLVIVEEELTGPVYRATLVGKKLVAVLRRDPPHVVGDGRRTVRELAAGENKNPLRRGPVFAEIDVDSPGAVRELKWQKFTPETMLKKGEVAFLHFKVNWGVGGVSRDATEETHPENRRLFEAIGEYLGDDIVGIDFMIPDITQSWKKQPCGVIECNSLPLIGNHHFPYTGEVRNVAGKIWDLIFPESAPRK
ncbi:MAG: hypothetical protein HYY10_01100 [Candidatus Liptonbacteria bacterium]|nr:hypothetical protein [Candidatus Liptonbacteria bacterium]